MLYNGFESILNANNRQVSNRIQTINEHSLSAGDGSFQRTHNNDKKLIDQRAKSYQGYFNFQPISLIISVFCPPHDYYDFK